MVKYSDSFVAEYGKGGGEIISPRRRRGGGYSGPVFPSIPTSGLTHFWPMDDAHVSGTIVTDTVGALNGVASGSGVSSGGYKRNLNGVDHIALASSPIADYSQPATYFFWAALTDPTQNGDGGGSQTFLHFSIDANNGIRIANDETGDEGSGDNFPSTDFVASLFHGGTNVQVEIGTDWGNGSPLDPNAPLVWKKGADLVNVIITYDGAGNIGQYINGSDFQTFNFSRPGYSITAGSNMIGARTSGNGHVTGAIGAVGIYNRVVTAQEALQIFHAGPSGLPSRKRLAKMTAVGASNTTPNSYFEYSLPSLQVGIGHANPSVNGNAFSDFDTNFVSVVQPHFDTGAELNILVLQCTNDMDINGTTGAVAAALAASIATKWKALGASAKVIIFAAWNFGGNAAFIQKHVDFNTAVQANSVFDRYVDVFNIPGLNTGTSAPDVSLSPDNNHLTKLAHQTLVAPLFITAVNVLWSA